MSKQASTPPPGDKPAVQKPPPPPPMWRHWLLPVGLLAALFLWLYLPAVHQSGQTTLSYSQFLSDVSAHKVKTITIAQAGGTSTGTLTSGTNYSVVIPQQASQGFLDQITSDGVQTTASTTSPSFGAELFDWILILAPFLLLFWFWRRLSRGGAGSGAMQGIAHISPACTPLPTGS